jgi:hypothetical protein
MREVARFPSEKEISDSTCRRDKYFRQSKTIKNPNLLTSLLQKDHGLLIRFSEKRPQETDLPIYIYCITADRLDFIQCEKDLQEFLNINMYDLLWTKQFIGD